MTKQKPYVVLGVTGNTGANVASTLLSKDLPVRVVVREASKGESWSQRGAEVVSADMLDEQALKVALTDAAGVYFLNPPAYFVEDLFARAEQVALKMLSALSKADVPKVVVLSSIGAHLQSGTGNILTNHRWEELFSGTTIPVTFVRAAWFIENWRGVAGIAAEQGILPSFLSPLDRAFPMVAAADIGRVCAESLLEEWSGNRVIELEGPTRYTPNNVAAAFSQALEKPVNAMITPEAEWEQLLTSWGISKKAVLAWCEMLKAFNSGLIAFQGKKVISIKGKHTLTDTIAGFFK